jgi:hypothetical protein
LLGLTPDSPAGAIVAAAEFVLEGLAGLRKIGRSEERGYHRGEARRAEVGFEQVDSAKSRLN